MKKQPKTVKAPIAPQIPVYDEHHGVRRRDNYAWMRADNWQEVLRDPTKLDEKIANHLEAENLYQSTFMSDTLGLQQTLIEEMKGRIKQDDSSVPYKDGPFAYGRRYETGDEYPLFFRTPREGGEHVTYLNGNIAAQASAYFRLGVAIHAPDHQKLVWSYDDKGSEYYTLKIRDFATLTDRDEVILETSGAVAWDGLSQGFFYAKLDANHRADKVYYHRLGTSQQQDVLIYEEQDPGFFVSLEPSLCGDFVLLHAHDHETSEAHIITATQPLNPPRLVRKREKGVEYSVVTAKNKAFILTNLDQARDFKIMRAQIDEHGQISKKDTWQEIVAHKQGRLILYHQAYQNHLVWLERMAGQPRIVIRQRSSGTNHIIAFDEEAYALNLIGAVEYDSRKIRFHYASMTTPMQVFDYDMDSRMRKLLKVQEIPSGHITTNYITRRLMVEADDGEQIPVSLLSAASTPLDGTAPCLVYGYGAYGISIDADFSANILSLVDRGFIYAIAHIRGGKDKGFAWYEQGKHHNKRNSFNDFIAVGRYLVANNFTSHDRLIAEGGSAGGMLMGAIANIAPQDYAAIVAIVPFVDVLTTMLDANLPLTPPEWPEWGNPLENAQDYALIASYSPYDNVAQRAYPPILSIAGLTDPRVTYWEPAKWVAKLRQMKTNDHPVLLRVNMEAGHGGAGGRLARLEETAYIYAFMLKIVGNHKA